MSRDGRETSTEDVPEDGRETSAEDVPEDGIATFRETLSKDGTAGTAESAKSHEESESIEDPTRPVTSLSSRKADSIESESIGRGPKREWQSG